MTLPTSFKLGAHTWRVRVVKSIGRPGASCYGECDFMDHKILIAQIVEGKSVSAESMYQTFLHEFVHAALHILGRNDDEELAAGLEQMLYQLHKTARYPKGK